MNIKQKIALFTALLLIGILSILTFTTLYLNNDPDGFSWGFQLKGISERHDQNYQEPQRYNLIYIHSITQFVNLYKENSQNYITTWDGHQFKPTVYRAVHYADSHPFYTWWFNNGNTTYVYDAWAGDN